MQKYNPGHHGNMDNEIKKKNSNSTAILIVFVLHIPYSKQLQYTIKYYCFETSLYSRGTLMPGRTYELLIDAEVDVGDVTEVKFRWRNHILNPMRPKYGASKIELQRGRDEKMWVWVENVLASLYITHADAVTRSYLIIN